MSESYNNSDLLSVALAKILKPLVKEAVQEVMGQNGRETTLLTVEELAVLGTNGHRGHAPSETSSPYLTIKEAAKLSRLGESTIRLAIRKRQLRAHQVGSRVIVKRTDLEQFLEAQPIVITPD